MTMSQNSQQFRLVTKSGLLNEVDTKATPYVTETRGKQGRKARQESKAGKQGRKARQESKARKQGRKARQEDEIVSMVAQLRL